MTQDTIHFLTCGHVDDGKSTFIGRLLHDMGAIPQDQISGAMTNGKIDYSRLTDGLEDERSQGITIDVAYRYFRAGKRHYRIADTPGHLQYLRNMAVAATDSHCAFLLVDASHGVREQSLRHSKIAHFLGVKSFVIIVNKMDLIDYSEEKFREIEHIYREHIASWIDPIDMTFIPVSAIMGDNITKHSDNMPWYQGTDVLSYLLEFTPPVWQQGHVRFPVQNVIRITPTVRGYQGFVSGGDISIGDKLKIVHNHDDVTVTALYHSGQNVQKVTAGQSITLSVAEDKDISRGTVLASSASPAHYVDNFDADIIWLDYSENPVHDFSGLLKIHHQTETTSVIVHHYDGVIAKASVMTANPVASDIWDINPRTGLFLLIEAETQKVKAIGKVTADYSESLSVII